MAHRFILLMILGTFCLPLARASAQLLEELPLDVRVTDQTKLTDRNKTGSSESKKYQNSYTAELRNTTLDRPMEGLRFRLISFFSAFGSGRGGSIQSGSVQIRDEISLAPGESKRIDFNTEDYSQGESKGTSFSSGIKTITITYSGKEYEGVVLEIYSAGRLVGTRFDGSAPMRKAYEAWVAGGSQTGPGSQQIFPPMQR